MRKNARVLIAYGSGDAPGMLRNRGKMALEGTLRLKMLPSGSVNLGRLGLGGQDGGILPSCTEQKWRLYVILPILLRSNTARATCSMRRNRDAEISLAMSKSAAGGGVAMVAARIFSIAAVTLSVVKTLATAMSWRFTPKKRACATARRSDASYAAIAGSTGASSSSSSPMAFLNAFGISMGS